MNLQFSLDFLTDLAAHNSKEWMDDNKKRYQEAKGYVIELVAEVLSKSIAFDPSLQEIDPRKSLFRINRDIRFSKNKDPYKTNFGAFLVPGGKKSGNPGYYIHIMPENSFYGGGIYQPDATILQKVRQEIDYNGEKIRSIITDPSFVNVYPAPHSEEKLKTAPKGYPKDHPDLDLLQLKHYVYMHGADQRDVVAPSFVDQVVAGFRVLYPYNQFLNEAIS